MATSSCQKQEKKIMSATLFVQIKTREGMLFVRRKKGTEN